MGELVGGVSSNSLFYVPASASLTAQDLVYTVKHRLQNPLLSPPHVAPLSSNGGREGERE